jgi:hypothetical protein
MRVLITCEYSAIVRDAFIAKGHDAMSCDLLPTDAPGPHIEGDCIPVIKEWEWDLIIMHPPCTALAVSGNRWYGKDMAKHSERLNSIKWTMALWDLAISNCSLVCMENPVGVLPIKPSQYIQPWQYGHGETKKTGLWLYGLPKLKPTEVVEGREQRIWKLPPSADRWKIRSTTFTGIAQAMADQWGDTA